MGLFDSATYDPSTYAGGGGMIDRLLAQLEQQNQYQPSAGLGPMQAPAQQNANPIAVGNYQMPRIGGADQFNPQQVMTPPNAQPAQGQNYPFSVQQQQPSGQPMQQLPSILQQPGTGLADHLKAGFQGLAANAHNGPIGMLMGAVGGAMGMESPEKQNLRAQYQSLIPILGEAKARLAVLNPEIGKQMVAQALSGKQYAFTTAPDGTVIRTDAHAGTAEPVYQAGLKPTFGVIGEQDGQKTYGWIDPSKRTTTAVGGLEPRGDTVIGPDGKPIKIPEGGDRKEFIKKVTDANAKAATGEKTEVQANSEIFANRMELAEKNLKGIDTEGQSFLNRVSEGSGYLPGSSTAGRYLQSDKYQAYLQAKNSFISAKLRKESGAAISPLEYEREDKEFFPQPGDGKEVIRQKAEARRIATEAMKKGAGPGYKSPNFDNAGGGSGKSDPLGIR